MRHPTDTVRLPVRTRSDEAAGMLHDVEGWLEEIDQVLATITPHERLAKRVRRDHRTVLVGVDTMVAT
jgi:hypothetical protein